MNQEGITNNSDQKPQETQTTPKKLMPIENPGTDPSVYGAQLLLKDEFDTVLEFDTKEQELKQSNTLALIEQSKKIVEPYNSVFDTKIPSADTNTRDVVRSRLGRKTSRVNIGELRTNTWRYRTNEKHPLIYDYRLLYRQGNKVNSLAAINVEISTEKEKEKGDVSVPNLRLGFDEIGDINNIRLHCGAEGSKVLQRILEGSPLGKIIDKVSFPMEKKPAFLDIEVDINKGIVRIVQNIKTNAIAGDDSNLLRCFYRLSDLEEEVIERFTGEEEAWNLAEEDQGKKLASTLSGDEYFQVIQGLTSLIPVAVQR